MKEITVVMGMILAMLVIMVFPCWGEDVIYYGCYEKRKGDLRIVDNPNKCKRPEVPIYWNQIGPQGPPGHSPVLTWSGDQIAIDGVVSGPHLTGPQGPQGPPGSGGISDYEINQTTVSCAPYTGCNARSECTGYGMRIISGGYDLSDWGVLGWVAFASKPYTAGGDKDAWEVYLTNQDLYTKNVTVYSICADLLP